ncbi:hypothetical protein [Peptoniphilus sp.]|uniref:hypothetical protein n=1 Tax=Peptoniphilus sp. TaxID=1971214 RepID=UPI002A755904|nr:hypothetical protein [Peptoniphilus sp.]
MFFHAKKDELKPNYFLNDKLESKSTFNKDFDAHMQEVILLKKESPIIFSVRSTGNNFKFISRSELCENDSYKDYEKIYIEHVLGANLEEGDFMPSGVYFIKTMKLKLCR